MENIRANKKLMQRFAKDYNLPINVFNEEMFNYYAELYDFFPKETWENLCKTIEEKYNGSVEQWLDYCAKVRDDAIFGVMNTEEYKEFNTCDMKKWDINPKVPQVGEHSIYNELNVGKFFVSIDLKKANFQALKYVGVIKDETYEDFMKKFGADDYIIGSKYLRQVIFGKMNPSRAIKVEKHIMGQIYLLIKDYFESRGYEFYSLNSDEIIFKEPRGEMFRKEGSKDYYLEDLIEKILGIEVRIEYIYVTRLDIINVNGNKVDAYVKHNMVTAEDTLKKASTLFYPQIYKLWKQMEINAMDKIFFAEDQLATFNEPLRYATISI